MHLLFIRVFLITCLLASCQPNLIVKSGKKNVFKIDHLAFSPDGNSLAYTAITQSRYDSFSNSIGLWELKSGKIKKTTKITKRKIQTIFFSPDGQDLALMYSSGFKTNYGFIWHIDGNELSEKQSYMPEYLGPTSVIAISPDKKFTAQPDLEGRIRLWNNTTKKIIKTYQFEHVKTINAMQFTSDNKKLIIVGQYLPPYRYDSREEDKYKGPTLLVSIDLAGNNENIFLDTKSNFPNFQKNTHRLLTRTRNKIEIWDGFRRTLIQKIDSIGNIEHIQLSQNGHYLVAAIKSNLIILPDDKPIEMEYRSVVVIWDVKTGLPFHVLTDGTRSTTSLTISLDNETLATGDDQGVIRLWNMKTGKMIKHKAVHGEKQQQF